MKTFDRILLRSAGIGLIVGVVLDVLEPVSFGDPSVLAIASLVATVSAIAFPVLLLRRRVGRLAAHILCAATHAAGAGPGLRTRSASLAVWATVLFAIRFIFGLLGLEVASSAISSALDALGMAGWIITAVALWIAPSPLAPVQRSAAIAIGAATIFEPVRMPAYSIAALLMAALAFMDDGTAHQDDAPLLSRTGALGGLLLAAAPFFLLQQREEAAAIVGSVGLVLHAVGLFFRPRRLDRTAAIFALAPIGAWLLTVGSLDWQTRNFMAIGLLVLTGIAALLGAVAFFRARPVRLARTAAVLHFLALPALFLGAMARTEVGFVLGMTPLFMIVALHRLGRAT